MEVVLSIPFLDVHPEPDVPSSHSGRGISGNVTSQELMKGLEFLHEHPWPIQAVALDVRMSPSQWFDADDRIIAAVLGAEDLATMSPRNVFEPRFSGTHFGRVPEDETLILESRPSGLLAGSLDETIFKPGMARFLSNAGGGGQMGEVEFTHAGQSTWVRYFPDHDVAVLAPENIRGIAPCVGCGTESTWTWGQTIALGRSIAGLTVARDVQGDSHLGLRRPYIVSRDVTQEIEQTYGKGRTDDLPGAGYTLSPVINMESDLGKLIVDRLELAAR